MNNPLACFCLAALAMLFTAGASGQPSGVAPGAAKELTPAEQKAADLRLPSLDRSSFTPESRVEEKVEEGEKSPFGATVSGKPGTAAREPVTEEKRIRNILTGMRVSGLSGSPGSYRALVGPIMMVEGEILPKLFADQAEVLRVNSISETEILLGFVESDESMPSRTIGFRFSLDPRPGSLLPGELFRKLVPLDEQGIPLVPPQKNESAEAVADAIERQELQSLVDRPTELLDAPAPAPKSDVQKEEPR